MICAARKINAELWPGILLVIFLVRCSFLGGSGQGFESCVRFEVRIEVSSHNFPAVLRSREHQNKENKR